MYQTFYSSPLGKITLASDGENLTGLWLEKQKYDGTRPETAVSDAFLLPIFAQVKTWLDVYFSGEQPNFMPPLSPAGTPYQQQVWQLLREIPYGRTVTYGQIAQQFQEKHQQKTSARAIGGAIAHNPIGILVPCHRVLGAGGKMTGYAGGIDKKIKLLQLEGVPLSKQP